MSRVAVVIGCFACINLCVGLAAIVYGPKATFRETASDVVVVGPDLDRTVQHAIFITCSDGHVAELIDLGDGLLARCYPIEGGR